MNDVKDRHIDRLVKYYENYIEDEELISESLLIGFMLTF